MTLAVEGFVKVLLADVVGIFLRASLLLLYIDVVVFRNGVLSLF